MLPRADQESSATYFASELSCANQNADISANHACNSVIDQKWCIDSGCTSYLCKDPRLFTQSHKTDEGVRLANDATAKVTAKGDVRIIASNGKHDRQITLCNALCVPDLRTNLMSVAKIVDKGYEVLFTKRRAYVNDASGDLRLIADREGDLFCLREGREEACTASSYAEGSSREWHQRLGHLNWNDMSLMRRRGSASGLNFRTDDVLPACDVCALGKISHIPFFKRDLLTLTISK